MSEKKLHNQSTLSVAALLGASFVWGMTFVAQSVAMETLRPYTYNGARFLLGFVVLLPIALAWGKKDPLSITYPDETVRQKNVRPLLLGGLLCGLCLFVASSFQQVGIQYTTAGKSGFITTLYIVLVPILGLFLKRKCSPLVIPAIFLAVAGFYLLSIREGFTINKGDAITLGCALVFSFHILIVDKYSPQTDPLQLSCAQFLIAGILSMITALLIESPTLETILLSWKPIAFAAIFSGGIGYTLQIVGQRGLHPAIAALLMSLESVFAVLSGWLILGDVLSRREIFGCVLVFAAVLLAQVPVPDLSVLFHRRKKQP